MSLVSKIYRVLTLFIFFFQVDFDFVEEKYEIFWEIIINYGKENVKAFGRYFFLFFFFVILQDIQYIRG